MKKEKPKNGITKVKKIKAGRKEDNNIKLCQAFKQLKIGCRVLQLGRFGGHFRPSTEKFQGVGGEKPHCSVLRTEQESKKTLFPSSDYQ